MYQSLSVSESHRFRLLIRSRASIQFEQEKINTCLILEPAVHIKPIGFVEAKLRSIGMLEVRNVAHQSLTWRQYGDASNESIAKRPLVSPRLILKEADPQIPNRRVSEILYR